MKRPQWTTKQVQYLDANYSRDTEKQIAEMFGKTPNAVRIKAQKRGIYKGTPRYNGYQAALPPEQWPMARMFIGMLVLARAISQRTGKVPSIDLMQFRNAFMSLREGQRT